MIVRANRSERRGDQKARASLDDASCRVSGVADSFNNVAGSTHKESKWVRQWLIVAGRTGAGFPAADSERWVPGTPELRMRGLVPLRAPDDIRYSCYLIIIS